MVRVAEVPEMAALIPEVDLSARVVYFPVRHHSPACAWHVDRLIRELQPDSVLIEGPRDATPLIPLLTHEQTLLPVAIYSTFVRRSGKDKRPERFAAYYPLCDYSPELAAIRVAKETGAKAEFIDLTFPEQVLAEQDPKSGKPGSLLDERYLAHSRLLLAACQRCGVRDPDDLWDHLYEVDGRELETTRFMRDVLAYCALARQSHAPEMLAADGCLAREAAMAAAIKKATGRVVVVTGGFHAVALPTTKPKKPKRAKLGGDDALVVLMRYGFEQLDRLNGYASGMPSPEFYQRVWDGDDLAELIVDLGRSCRQRNLPVSTADAIAALDQTQRLAQLRSHSQPSREDLLDGIRSAFIKGSEETDGVQVMELARKLLAGERIGNVPDAAGQPPIVDDFQRTAARLRLDLKRIDGREITLDLYRKTDHRLLSRFFNQLRFLDVPFAEWVRGPDFVQGENLERIQEVWRYQWSPSTESSLIQLSVYGSTVEEAATALLLERFDEAEQQGEGRRADVAAQLVMQSCRMGLHKYSRELLDRTAVLIAQDHWFIGLVDAMEQLLTLRVSREPLEAHHLVGIEDVLLAAYHRACFLISELAATPPEEEERALDALNALNQAVNTMGDAPEHRELRWGPLEALTKSPDCNPTIQGGAVGMLFGDGQMAADELAQQLRAHLHGTRDDDADGPNFLRGLMRTARSALWQVPRCIACIHDVLREWDEDRFLEMLPLLRLAMADLTPRECDQVARSVAAHVGIVELSLPKFDDVSSAEAAHAMKVNQLVRESLQRDGLEEYDG